MASSAAHHATPRPGPEAAGASGLGREVDRFFEIARGFGASALIYDYTPRHRETDGTVTAPAVMMVRNLDPGMIDYWCGRGYAHVDPVQAVAVNSVAPFVWSYDAEAGDLSASFLTRNSRPVVEFISASGFVNGITVPIHLPGGGYVTVNGLWNGPGRAFAAVAAQVLPGFALMAQAFQNDIGAPAPADPAPPQPQPRTPALSARERECLDHAAQGRSAKETSRLIERSVPTVVMHLNAAVRKLGARNRSHAVAEAVRRGLI
ncbi:helix-turn-helix transcriptional regulator [Rhodobacter capsulatus]|uniref:Autoinducer-binding transcriptional regulator, LuxR family n=1 Tax=Rhodobacter capsulatus (strain ATCC BAA-309 / NBRC 16581 / SB1003) TaxID=272942 RepID=D5ARH7_RHOCB|nr:autoinducer binding domain-containing protein [Rhodobacter capsulatus]ADE84848.1 autoinducer-binding transcriptional regulator, LuxR family [Rhodobacter capsulatus SB 1003]MDS0925750.1 autoinducer binding domain-containing protein [Rhodobacter capsulatus]TQD32397.1 LuxR family transcriptional regulator [Rhodobacter capsulatus]